MTERTLILVKPDGYRRKKMGEILKRVEEKGYDIVAADLRTVSKELLDQHYNELVDKPFYPGLVEYMTSGPILAIVAQGDSVVQGWRTLLGNTQPSKAAPGTIRGDLARDWPGDEVRNIAHGSDSVESAEREIALWFPNLSNN
ncbi:MAG: nucleoside-diphosphate kinase [Lactobacillaceae bacterium]|jgi:nucleoside-diphosphate kinase|nr:nucleoside-diphosphate kinase [Lactobacillaceae bacterium]